LPPARARLLNIGWSSRILAFRSGPVVARELPPLTYP